MRHAQRIGHGLRIRPRRRRDLDDPKTIIGEPRQAQLVSLNGYGFSVVVITMGASGSASFAGRDIITQPAIPTKVVDSLGVGDAFIGAFLSQWVREKTIKVSLEFAANYAANTCLINGAF